ncbi:glycine receptor subunit alphaZ1-like isoform X2 [Mizuhopecten yessoensis]|uniref:Glycine receptor subunit alpha-3 n=1 Tax=Mizuhopecten yessoensis TaxID=6573 RepID=A0A210Q9B4_MIZYE|nr:glycine receptor subunit alphaZ1-like isoform X2 [Mizuhopecten yessoensis]OWF45321.1 Glycine receptor subunit alpha-3 [Mizuhopecten yessoensis]
MFRRPYDTVPAPGGKPFSKPEESYTDILRQLLDDGTYDSKISPEYEEDTPTSVTIQIYVMSIDSLNEASMDYTVTIFLRQKWVDTRLKYTPVPGINMLELDNRLIDQVWVPDTFFANEKSASFHYVTVPNKLMHLYANGTVFYSVRVSMTLSCDMNLLAYPLDSQKCHIALESYSYTTDNVVFEWHPFQALEIQTDRLLPQFYFSGIPTVKDSCQKNYGESGNFSCLEVTLHLTRNTGYYIAQIFIPSILIVMLSWVSFWVDAEATPARISLGVLTVLTITTQGSGARSTLPRVSYIKAIDIWMATCLMFVFASLLEFAYINVLSRKRRSKLLPSLGIGPDGMLNTQAMNGNGKNDMKRESSAEQVTFTDKARMVDKVSRVIFPCAFALFNLVFWSYFLTNSE